VELTVPKGVVIHVKSGHGVDPYFDLSMPKSMKGWQKKWFYLRNDASTPLPIFTSSCPVPLPSWGDGVARKDLSKFHPMREALQQLRQEGLTGTHLLWTFFSRRIQPLRRQKIKMWLYPGPSCPDRPFSVELSTVEVDSRVHKVLDLGVNPNPGAGPTPLQGGVASARVSTLDLVLLAFTILSFHCAAALCRVLGWSW
jgi:hypothetical protein